MNRALVVLSILALAASARAADPAPSSDVTSSSMHKEPSAKTSKPPSKSKPKQLSKKDQQILDTKNAKAGFMAAMSSCTRPETCDPKAPGRDREAVRMVEESEKRFMEACQACAKPEVCEAERARIREGRGRFGSNPCK